MTTIQTTQSLTIHKFYPKNITLFVLSKWIAPFWNHLSNSRMNITAQWICYHVWKIWSFVSLLCFMIVRFDKINAQKLWCKSVSFSTSLIKYSLHREIFRNLIFYYNSELRIYFFNQNFDFSFFFFFAVFTFIIWE